MIQQRIGLQPDGIYAKGMNAGAEGQDALATVRATSQLEAKGWAYSAMITLPAVR